MGLIIIINRWLHLIAAFTWLGGLIFMNLVLTPAVVPKGIPPQFVRLMGIKRFRAFAWGSIVVLVITGTTTTVAKLSSLSDFWSTNYGIILGIKILLVALMIAITSMNSLVIGPKLMSEAPKPPNKPSVDAIKLQRRLVINSYIVLGLGLAVLLMVSILLVI